MRKVVLLATIISAWVTSIHAGDVPWVLSNEDAKNYSDFIAYIRGQVKGKTCFGIPMIRESSPKPYLLVSLQSTQNNTGRLVLSKKDLYVVGYADKIDGTVRAFYFKGVPTNVTPEIPSGAVSSLSYTGSYKDLEKYAGIGPKKLGLSKAIVNRLLDSIYGKAITTAALKKDQAQFLLIVVQMVAEAARFKYIEQEIMDNYTKPYITPNAKVLTIVNEWGKITTAIVNAERNGSFQSRLTLTGPDGVDYNVTKVDDVKKDMGMLKYVAKDCKKTLSFQTITGIDLLAQA